MVMKKKLQLGELLLQGGVITVPQLEQALEFQEKKGGKLGDILVKLKFVDEKLMYETLAQQLGLEYVDIEHYNINPLVATKIPERLARRFKVLALDFVDKRYVVAMSDPTDEQALEEISRVLDGPIQSVLSKEDNLLVIMNQVYRRTEDIASYAKELKEELGAGGLTPTTGFADLGEETAPVAKLLDSIFEDAVQVGASDIHIEPGKKQFHIRQRIDGILHENVLRGTTIVSALVLRIKLMAKLDISEKRLPQDGRTKIVVKGHEIDVRVSTMPVRFGESVVMRLLNQTEGVINIKEVGFTKEIMKRVNYLITRPNGLILVTGPTGSGKTTTLYAILSKLNSPEKKIITIEDPIEYTIPRVNQVQVNAEIELTFARVLRASLRQDPDIILVGEMRDEETAQIGLRASITGHLVLSTLHTNDAIGSAIRLIDMGAEGYLVAAALKAIFSQRLVRKICSSCAEIIELPEKEKEWLSILFGTLDPSWVFKQGRGCTRCNKSGYQGRIAVHELLEMNTELINTLKKGDSVAFAEAAARQKSFKPLTLAAFDLAKKGVITITEVLRVASEIEDVGKKVGDNFLRVKKDISQISI